MSDHPTPHPSWCDSGQCDVDNALEGFGAHRSAPLLLNIGFQVLADAASVRLQLHQSGANWPTYVYVTIEADRARATLELAEARRMLREVGALLASAAGAGAAELRQLGLLPDNPHAPPVPPRQRHRDHRTRRML